MMVAQRHTGPVRVSMLLLLEPVFAAVFAWTLGGERATVAGVAGGALIVSAMLATELARASREPLTRGPLGGSPVPELLAVRPPTRRPPVGQPVLGQPVAEGRKVSPSSSAACVFTPPACLSASTRYARSASSR